MLPTRRIVTFAAAPRPTSACAGRSMQSTPEPRTRAMRISEDRRNGGEMLVTAATKTEAPGFRGLTALYWRRERDSNPRYGFCPYTPLAGARLRPLGHLS